MRGNLKKPIPQQKIFIKIRWHSRLIKVLYLSCPGGSERTLKVEQIVKKREVEGNHLKNEKNLGPKGQVNFFEEFNASVYASRRKLSQDWT